MPKVNDPNTVEIRIRLFTDGVPKRGQGHAWDKGVVFTVANDTLGVPNSGAIPFNTLAGLPLALQKALKKAGMKVHSTGLANDLQP